MILVLIIDWPQAWQATPQRGDMLMGILKKKTFSIILTILATLGSIIITFPVMATPQTDASLRVQEPFQKIISTQF